MSAVSQRRYRAPVAIRRHRLQGSVSLPYLPRAVRIFQAALASPMTPRFHSLKVARVDRETADSVCLTFDVPVGLEADYRFDPGQHLGLRVRLGDEEMRRSYSICSAPHDAELRIAIKKVAGGRFSAWAVDTLAAGAAIDVMTPEGRFHTPLDSAHAKHYVAFAAGSGITPILSLAKTILAREPRSSFTLVYGNRRQASVMFHETLEDL